MAVVLTSDTTRFDAGFQKAAVTVSRFRNQVGGSADPMLNLGRATQAARAAIGGLNGNVLGAVGGLSKLGAAGGVAAAVIGLGYLAKKAVEARDALAVLRGEASLATEYDRLGKNATGLLATLGEILGLHKAAVNEAGTWSRILGRINEYLKTDEMREREESFKKQSAFLKEQKRLAEEFAAADKKANEERSRWLDDMRGRAESITKSMRTPGEIFADTVHELNHLFELGMIGVETLRRGTAQARDDLKAASDRAAETMRKFQQASAPIAAAERFTQAGASAVNAGRAEQQKLIELQKQEFEIAKKHLQAQEEGNRLLRDKKPVVFKAGAF